MAVRVPFRGARREIPFEFVYQLFSLLVVLIIVHAIYVALIRPRAAADIEMNGIRIAEDRTHVPERSIYVVVRDLEQESCFVLMFWALAIMGYKGNAVLRERRLLHETLISVPEGTRILPDDARGFARHIQDQPGPVLSGLVPRCLLTALHRFESSRSISDASSTVQSLCDAEGERLDSELSLIRYIVWAIPSIGFIGTVRGIGQALALAYQAVEGDITGVTQSLGVAFNSTFIALLISIVLMFLLHQLQLHQERLVLETESYLYQHLIQHLQVPQ